MSWVRRITEALRRMVSSPRNGEPVVIIRPDLAGLRGHIFNPFPTPDGKWTVNVADPYDTERWPAYTTGFYELSRWEFVRAEHGVKSWHDRMWEAV